MQSPYGAIELDGSRNSSKLCYLKLKPTQEDNTAVLGNMILQRLYTVIDLDNKAISIASVLDDGKDTGRDVISIPKEGLKDLNFTSTWLDGVPPAEKSGASKCSGENRKSCVFFLTMAFLGGCLL